MTGAETVAAYLAAGYRLCFWQQDGDIKGPTLKGWTEKIYSVEDYREGMRVGILTGARISEGKYGADIDLDWAPGVHIALAMLPPTSFVYGRKSKPVSHCGFTTPEPMMSMIFDDPIDKMRLGEIRGTKVDGSVGLQSMAPPSVWSKDGVQEPLEFRKFDAMAHIDNALLKQRMVYAMIGVLLAKHLGKNGFGHEPRLLWAGFLLRAGISAEDLIKMGEAISVYCNNTELADVRRSIESTALRLADPKQKIKGGPALAKHFGADKGHKIVACIQKWLGKSDEYIRNDKGSIFPDNLHNIGLAIDTLRYELSYDVFAGVPLVNSAPTTDQVFNDIRFQIEVECRFQPSKDYLRDAIGHLCWTNRFHPVKDYLSGVVWDKVKRLDTWLIECGGTEDSAYVRAISAIVLVAAVRRIKDPGCKYDEMVVLESHQQGLNKSTAIRILCPDSKWFSDDLPLNVNGQRVIEATVGKWIIEASELVGRRADREHLKSMLSRQEDHARMAYGHFPVHKLREFIIIGTTNSDDYLTDPTGSRRIWPLRVKTFDIVKLTAMRDQLWAEAVVREARGDSIRLPEELWPAAGEEQARRQEGNAFEEVLRDLLLQQEVRQGRRRIVSELLWTTLGIEMKDRPMRFKMLAETMTRLGFRRTTIRVDGSVNPQSGYISIDVADPLLMRAAQEEAEPKREVGDDDGDGTEQPVVKKEDDAPF